MFGLRYLLVAAHAVPLCGACQSDEWIQHHATLHRGEYLLYTGDTIHALATLDSAFVHLPWYTWYRLEATNAVLLQGDTLRAIGYLEAIYRAGGQPMLTYSDPIKGLLARGFEEPYLGRLRGAMEAWAVQADSVWIRALIEMKELDQSVRSVGDPRMLRNDSINLDRLIRLAEQRGFPSPDKVGASYGIVQLLLWHHRGELGQAPMFDHYVQLARTAIVAERVEPDFLCMHHDYAAWEAQEPMPYGTLIGYFRQDLKSVILPPRDEVDANRRRVGLIPIAHFAEMLGIPLSELPFPR